ncbi:MAG TPA: HD domain-containing protein, partial [Planctomycetota bacterium]|nr:HD domain-containing protein [Planctomycetota bacterium]
VREEISRMLLGPDPGGALRRLDAFAFLDEVLPEVAAGRGVPQPPEYHPEGDVLFHTIDVVEKLDRRNLATTLGALFHDVGKVRTLTVSDRIRFHGHDRISCDLAAERMAALTFPRSVMDAVNELIAEHLRIGSFLSWRRAKQLRFLGRADVLDHLALHRADRLSARAGLEVHAAALAELARMAAEPPPRAPLLRGDDLLRLGHPAGPRLREILEAVRDEQLEGRLATRDDAVEYVRRKYPLEPGAPSVR